MAGGFFARQGETWPTNENGPMLPLIQIVFSEVPFVPACLAEFSMLTMFLDRTDLPMGSSVTDQESDEWAIRVYRPGEVLIPLKEPDDLWSGEYGEDRAHFAFDKQFPPRITRIEWRRSDADDPAWENYLELLPDHDCDSDDLGQKYSECSEMNYETKVGGWPTFIQGGSLNSKNEFAFQVASEEKPRTMFEDNGNLYVYRTESGWQLEWDFY